METTVYILTLEHWSGQVIDIIGVYTDLEEAKRLQREYDLQRQGITLYKATLHSKESGDDKKRAGKKSSSKRQN